MLNKYIDNLKDDIINETCALINIPSISEETNDVQAPFGEHCKKVLEYTLKLGENLGFKSKNIDGYCGFLEFGSGENLVGIIGHLDVVPPGNGWNTPPFEATIKNGKIYGRGAIDDKGPVVSSLYAMKAVKDNLKINSRVRLILGLNEEKDWKCINRYKETEEIPTVGFSPDSDFPCIYAEKGICTIYLKQNYCNYNQSPIKITEIDCNNNAINVVPKYCKVTLSFDSQKVTSDNIFNFINTEIKNLKFDIEYLISENHIELISHGIQSHAAHPELGKNAISPMIILLNKIFKNFNCSINIFNLFDKYINTEFTGNSLDLNISDESGNLTLNVGDLKLDENNIQIGLNLRIPVYTPIEKVFNIISEKFNDSSIQTCLIRTQNPLYVPKTSSLVQTLCNIFNEETGSNLEPIAIGGGTYARAFKNCICFGANFPGDTDMCHQVNEFIDIDKLILSCKIYAKAIYELAK